MATPALIRTASSVVRDRDTVRSPTAFEPCIREVFRLARDVLERAPMRVGLEALDDVPLSSDVREAVSRKVRERFASSVFAGVEDLRLRLRQSKGALLCVAIVGFAGGDLVTSTATRDTPLEAVVDALDSLPERIDRVHRLDGRAKAPANVDRHAAVREELKKLLDT